MIKIFSWGLEEAEMLLRLVKRRRHRTGRICDFLTYGKVGRETQQPLSMRLVEDWNTKSWTQVHLDQPSERTNVWPPRHSPAFVSRTWTIVQSGLNQGSKSEHQRTSYAKFGRWERSNLLSLATCISSDCNPPRESTNLSNFPDRIR
jgi:hypothetical protein